MIVLYIVQYVLFSPDAWLGHDRFRFIEDCPAVLYYTMESSASSLECTVQVESEAPVTVASISFWNSGFLFNFVHILCKQIRESR